MNIQKISNSQPSFNACCTVRIPTKTGATNVIKVVADDCFENISKMEVKTWLKGKVLCSKIYKSKNKDPFSFERYVEVLSDITKDAKDEDAVMCEFDRAFAEARQEALEPVDSWEMFA